VASTEAERLRQQLAQSQVAASIVAAAAQGARASWSS
jgi:hypothetical protein